MPDEPTVTPPIDGTTVIEPTPTPEDPAAAPVGMIPQEDQTGTTDASVRAEKEQLYQEKYQRLVESQKALKTELDTYQTNFGPLNQALEQANQPTGIQPASSPEEGFEFDPYDQEKTQQYFDHKFNQIASKLMDSQRDSYRNIRAEEKYTAQAEAVNQSFGKWAIENQVPQELINEAVTQYKARWGDGGTPNAVVEYVMGYIVDKSKDFQAQQLTAQQVAAAVTAGQQLAGMETPPQGAPPSPSPPMQITAQQQRVDAILPDDPEPKFD